MVILPGRTGQHSVICDSLDEGIDVVAQALQDDSLRDSHIILDLHCHGPLPERIAALAAMLERTTAGTRRVRSQHIHADSAFTPDRMVTVQATISHTESHPDSEYTYLSWVLLPRPEGMPASVHETAQTLLHDAWARGEHPHWEDTYQTARQLLHQE
jgi:uncharacterized small protein (DUF1192 family)